MAKAVPIHKLTDPDRLLRDSAPVLMVRLQEMLDYAVAAHSPANVQDLHDMRIAAKRLRYTLELFAPVLPAKSGSALLATVTEIQERIGAIHDCDVLFPLLRDTMEHEMEREHKAAQKRGAGPPPFLAAEGLAALTARKRTERNRLYQEFLTYWDALPPEKLAADFAQMISDAENPGTLPKRSRKPSAGTKVAAATDAADPNT